MLRCVLLVALVGVACARHNLLKHHLEEEARGQCQEQVDLPEHLISTPCIGSDMGSPYMLMEEGEFVQKLELFLHSKEGKLYGARVTFTSGLVQMVGKKCSGECEIKVATADLGVMIHGWIRMGYDTIGGTFKYIHLPIPSNSIDWGDSSFPFAQARAEAAVLSGIYGRSGDWVDGLGLIYTKPVQKAALIKDNEDSAATDAILGSTAPKSLLSVNMRNDGGQDQQQSFAVQQTVSTEQCDSTTLTNTFTIGMSMGFEAEAFGLKSGMSMEMEFSVDWEIHKEKCDNDEQTKTSTMTFVVPPFSECKGTSVQQVRKVDKPWSGTIVSRFKGVAYADTMENWRSERTKYFVKEVEGVTKGVEAFDAISLMDCKPLRFASAKKCDQPYQHVRCATITPTDATALDVNGFISSIDKNAKVVFSRPTGASKMLWVYCYGRGGTIKVEGVAFPSLEELSWQPFGYVSEEKPTVEIELLGDAVVGGVYFGKDIPVGLLLSCAAQVVTTATKPTSLEEFSSGYGLSLLRHGKPLSAMTLEHASTNPLRGHPLSFKKTQRMGLAL